MQPSKLRIKFHILYINSGFVRWHLTEHQFSSQMPLTLQTTTILAEFVGTKQRWSWYPAGVKIRHLPGKSSRRLGQFGARATRKIALRYSVSVGRSEKPLRPVPATAPWVSRSGKYNAETMEAWQKATLGAAEFLQRRNRVNYLAADIYLSRQRRTRLR